MKLIKIGNIGQIISGSTPKTGTKENWNGNIPWATPKEISSLETPFLNDTNKKITEVGYNSCSTHLLPKGSILFTSRAPIGLVGIANIDVCTNQGFKSIVLKDSFYPLYIYYALKYSTARLKGLGSGTTFKELSKTAFENFELPIPEFKEQVRIATALNKAQNLISDRKESLLLLDKLAQNLFIKIFGDPFTNPKKLKKEQIGTICTVTKLAGYEYTKYIKYKTSGEIIAVRGLNVKEGKIKLENLKYIDKETSNSLQRSKLFKDDIVMTYIGVNIGDVALVEKNDKFHLAPNVAKITSKNTKQINPIYLLHALIINRSQFTKKSNNTAKQSLNMANIRKTEILIPSPESQMRFQTIIAKIERLKDKYINGLSDVNKMYNSLIERAFKLKDGLNLAKLPIKITSSANLPLVRKGISKINTKSSTKEIKPKNYAIASANPKESKLIWEKVSTEQISTWIKENYSKFHFSSEMITNFLTTQHVTFLHYHSSEDLKKNAQLNESDDMKSFIFSAVNGTNPFIRFNQFFFNAQDKNAILKVTDEDAEFLNNKTIYEISGIYFNIIE